MRFDDNLQTLFDSQGNTMKKLMYLLTILAVSLTTTHAQVRASHPQSAASDAVSKEAAIRAKQLYVGAPSPDTTTTCTYSFTSGTGNKFLKYCVTVNGNIVTFQSPAGREYLATAPIGEGYAFCDFGTATQYFDYAGYGDSGNWQAPVKVSSSTTSVKISRKTTDGRFTLTQTITQNAGNALAQVTMALVNNSTTTRHVGLLRYADIDADGSLNNTFDYTNRTAIGYNNFGYGLQLAYVSGSAFNGAYSQDIPGGPNACQIFTSVLGPFNGDGSVFAQVDMMLNKGASGTFVTTYKSF